MDLNITNQKLLTIILLFYIDLNCSPLEDLYVLIFASHANYLSRCAFPMRKLLFHCRVQFLFPVVLT